jgi:hypothetical protein
MKWEREGFARTIVTADNGFLVVPLPDHDFDVGVCACKGLELGEEKSAGVLRRGPFVTILKDQFSDVGDESSVAVGGEGALGGTHERGRKGPGEGVVAVDHGRRGRRREGGQKWQGSGV